MLQDMRRAICHFPYIHTWHSTYICRARIGHYMFHTSVQKRQCLTRTYTKIDHCVKGGQHPRKLMCHYTKFISSLLSFAPMPMRSLQLSPLELLHLNSLGFWSLASRLCTLIESIPLPSIFAPISPTLKFQLLLPS